MTGYLTFGGISSASYGVSVDCSQSFATPERKIETAEVLGKNGDVITYDPGYFKMVVISYPCFIESGFSTRFPEFIAHLAAMTYHRVLRDSAHPDRYRMARFYRAVNPQTGIYNNSGSFTLEFECGVWYLDSGGTAVEFTEDGTITNPTAFISNPKYYVEGVGTVTIGSASFTTTVSPTTINVHNLESDNPFTGTFIRITPGERPVALGEGITLLRITPNWWTI